MVSWLVGDRDAGCAIDFMYDVAGRLKNSVQLTTDGHKAYLIAVDRAFDSDIDEKFNVSQGYQRFPFLRKWSASNRNVYSDNFF